uniref:Uncharacterized protein n=2 Tax=Phaeomonas parva TaxID=124430 RepID=A0A7S1UCN7_9STRA|mmetsp:Transcript_41694/g.130612  ORF Transcript_41694/g.130612 Transcript_41694/m.130612 type:complete len:111 (+) Transcript_41694:475-807(+)
MAQDEAREVAAAADDAPTITIPLHQRLQLIKAARPDVTTTAEAMKVLMSARGMDLDRADPWANAEAMVEKREDRGLGGEAEACVLSEKSVNEEVDPFAQDRFGCQANLDP